MTGAPTDSRSRSLSDRSAGNRRGAGDGDLLDIADRIVGLAEGGEQVEAYVGRSSDTQVRVYEGEVEQLAVAESLGVGVRVVRDHRQGFAYCGTFDDDALAETVAEARDNAAFAEPDEAAGLAEPDGVEPVALDLWRAGLADVPTDDKVALALELERAVRGADPRITGVESCDYADALAEAAIVTTTGIRRAARETGCELVAYSLAADGDDDPDRLRVLGGPRVRRPRRRRAAARRRRPGRSACSAPPSRRRAA